MARAHDLARRRRALDAFRTWRFGRAAEGQRPGASGQEGHARDLLRLDRHVQECHRVRFRTARAPLSRARLPELGRSEEHTSELQSLMRISYAVFCLQKKSTQSKTTEFSNKSNYTKYETQ